VMGYLVAERLPAAYESEATLLVGPVSADRETLQASGTQARTYAGIAQTSIILNRAAREVGMTPRSVENKLDVTASDITRLITIRARDGDAARAAAIANASALALADYARQQGVAAPPEGRLTIVERAVPSTNEIGPSKDLILPLAAIAGLLGALGLAAFVDSLSTVVRSEDELSAVAPVAVLGSVDGAGGRAPAVDWAPNSGAAATYRLLAAKIELWNQRNVPRSIVVVDARGGRSSVGFAANLAGALSEGGATVTLVDNGERGDAASLFGFSEPAAAGAEVRRGRPLRAGQLTLDRFRLKRSSLTILRLRNSSEPLEIETSTDLLRQLLEDADVVVVTVPPLERSPNSLVWSRAAEATILVTERDHTRREQIPADVESLRRVGAKVIGTVLYTNRGL
jgi:capsular polysaccharide biosynthesis protein